MSEGRLQAQTSTWTGGGADGNWSTALNWSGGTPVSGSSALIFDGTTNLNTTDGFGFAGFGPITFNSGAGAFTLAGPSSTIALGLGALSGEAQITNNSTNNQTFTVGLEVIGGGRLATFTTSAGGGNLTFGALGSPTEGVISGNSNSQNIVLQGGGAVTFYGNNTYTGTTFASAAALNLGNAAGTGTGALNLGAGTTLDNVSGGAMTIANASIALAGDLTFAGTNSLNFSTAAGSLAAISTTITLGGTNTTLTIGGGLTGASPNGPSSLTVNGAGNTLVINNSFNTNPSGAAGNALFTMNGSGNITVNGAMVTGSPVNPHRQAYAGTGTLTLAGANSFTGSFSVIQGTVIAGTNSLLNTNGVFGNNALAVALGDNASGTSLTGAASILTNGAFTIGHDITEVSNATNSSFTIGGNQTTGTSNYTGNIALTKNTTLTSATGGEVDFNTTGSNKISGAGGVIVNGGGTVVLGGGNIYTGGTTVNGGLLLANNATNSTGTGAVQVNNGGALGGSGTIATSGVTAANAVAVDIASGGRLSPSNGGVGFAHLTLALAANTTATLESGALLSFNLGANTAASDEVLITGGKLALNSQQFSDFTFNALSGIGVGTYTLIDSSNAGLTGSLGSVVTGSIDGGLFTGTLSLSGGDLLLNVAAVPEPGTWALMIGGLSFLVLIQRRRRA